MDDHQDAWREVDARGHRCPVPTLRLRRALDAAPPGARLMLLADDPMARIDVAHFAAQRGCTDFSVIEMGGGVLRFSLRTPVSADGADRGAPPA